MQLFLLYSFALAAASDRQQVISVMLSYRHAFHAGNHADVLKHTSLTLILQKMLQKDKSFCYIDTHAGAGIYNLRDAMAEKNREYLTGVKKIQRCNTPESLAGYFDVLERFTANDRYPGSPAIAAALLRPQDKLHFFELHNTEYANLQASLGSDKRANLYHRDGIEGALALSPPTPRRGFILIDPPFEQAAEYTAITRLVSELHRKWPVGVIAIWYPLLAKLRNRAPAMLASIKKTNPKSLFCAELWIKPQAQEYGMHGSGLALINLPWQVDEQLQMLLPALNEQLSGGDGGCRAEWLIAPQ